MIKGKIYALALCGTAFAAMPALAQQPANGQAPAAVQEEGTNITLTNRNEVNVGTVNMQQGPRGLLITVDVTGMSEGWHGFHIHETGDCSDRQNAFKTAGGHARELPEEEHGFLDERTVHAGDLPNIWVGETGAGRTQFYTDRLTINILDDHDGSAFVLHEGADDYRTDPAGDSGDRVACGVIFPMKT